MPVLPTAAWRSGCRPTTERSSGCGLLARLPENAKQRKREQWAGGTRRQRRDALEDASDEADSRYLDSLRPRLISTQP